MAPVQLALLSDSPARIPIVDEPFWIGRDPGCDLCLWDLRVSRRHARVSRSEAGFVVASEGRRGVFVNGTKVASATLVDGDELALTPPGDPSPIRMRFENRLTGVRLTADVSISTAWVERERARGGTPAVVSRFEMLGPLGDDGPTAPRLARERSTGRDVVLSVFEPVAVGAAADAWLRFLTAVAGAEHPSLARVVDGGLEAVEEGAMRWLASVFVRGRSAADRVPEGPQAAITVMRRMRAIAAALHLLHSRGVVHGGVTSDHVFLRTDGSAVLAGYGRAFLRRHGAFVPLPRPGVAASPRLPLPTPSSDVRGLATVACELLTGRLATPGAPLPPGALRAAGVAVPASLEDVLDRCLDPDPAARPTAEDVGQALAFGEASIAKDAKDAKDESPA